MLDIYSLSHGYLGNLRSLPDLPDQLETHAHGQSFITLAMSIDHAHRPTATALLDHSFLRNG